MAKNSDFRLASRKPNSRELFHAIESLKGVLGDVSLDEAISPGQMPSAMNMNASELESRRLSWSRERAIANPVQRGSSDPRDPFSARFVSWNSLLITRFSLLNYLGFNSADTALGDICQHRHRFTYDHARLMLN